MATELRKVTAIDCEFGTGDATSAGGHVGAKINATHIPLDLGLDTLTLNAAMLGLVVNVKAFGAVGDGSHDDATAIDDAVDYVGDAGGGTVFFPKGTYILGTESSRTSTEPAYILPRSNVNMIGVGESSVLKVKNGEAARLDPIGPRIMFTEVAISNCIFRDLTFDGNGLNNLLDGSPVMNYGMINSQGAGTNILIDNCTFKNNPGSNPVAFGTGGRNVVVRNCRFLEMGSAIPGNVNPDHTDIYLLGSSNKVIDCYFKSGARVLGAAWENHGIDFEAHGNYVDHYNVGMWITSEDGNCKTTFIHHNTFYHVYGAVAWSSGNNNGFGRVEFSNNIVIHDPDQEPADGYYAVYGPDTANDLCDEHDVHDNQFIGFAGCEVLLAGTIGCKIWRFYNNYCENWDHGVLLSTNAPFDGVYSNHVLDIHDNVFNNCTKNAIVDVGGGRVKVFNIRNNTFMLSQALYGPCIYLRTTVDVGGMISGYVIAELYDNDMDLGAGLAKVTVDHVSLNGFIPASGIVVGCAIGSRYTDVLGRQFIKREAATEVWHGIWWAAASPTAAAYWTAGDRCFNSAPSAGQPKGWICTVGGYGGTWVSEGVL